jgi:hypothetical protein
MNEKVGATTVVGVFGLILATIYLISYWGSFNFDIFQFAGLTDFVKLAIYPLALALVGIAGGMSLTTVLVPFIYARLKEPEWPLPKTVMIITAVCVIAAFMVQVLIHAQWRWPVTLLLSVVPMTVLTFHPRMKRLLPSLVLRMNFLMLFLVFPLFAAVLGSERAQDVKDGKSALIVDNTGIAANLKSTPDHPLTYVGFVSDTFVIYETATGSLILLKQSDTAPLVLKPNPNHRTDFHSRMALMGL